MLGNFATRRAVVTAATVVASLLSLAGIGSAQAAPTTPQTTAAADTYVATTCQNRPVQVPVRWYFPAGNPSGLVWLQHGFMRSATNLDGLATAYAKQGLLVASTSVESISPSGCGVAYNLADNTAFIATMASVFGHGTDPGSALSQSLRRAEHSTGRTDVAIPKAMVFSGHSAGGEFVLTAANALRRTDPVDYRRLSGLMLIDPVNSFIGNNFHTAAVDLGRAGLPIRVISSPPSISNVGGQGTHWLEQTTRQRFLGAQLTTGVHIDVEGADTDILGIASELAVPRPRNGRVIRTLAPHWTADLVDRHPTVAYYPGGRYYDLLLRTNTVTTLPVG
ncbi:alpha/beta hydrolase [Gordonia sp. CPCC 205515]|uniref:alpha/beta hydrolase n=1 Tax=Gordonia sp. CPCC 205515 TaxID=3140791 RepID=UPI003AF35D2E